MPMDLKPGQTLVIATHNAGKLKEFQALLAPFGLVLKSAGELGIPEPEETGDTFIANAELKAVASATASGMIALADDSGLAVDALGGAPGIFSARWAGTPRNFAAAMERVEIELSKIAGLTSPPSATFVCALSLSNPSGQVQSFEGRVRGHLTFPPRGDNGFGYDPIFIPDGHALTFGEMEPAFKDGISHRAAAFRQFREAVLDRKQAKSGR